MFRFMTITLTLILGPVFFPTLQDISASSLPLLSSGTHVGIIYSPSDPAAKEVLDAAFGETLAAGADVYELSSSWADLEPSPGEINIETLKPYLDILKSLNIKPYLALKTIDTVTLNLPSDLADGELKDGRHFNDHLILDRFHHLMDALVPLLVESGTFFISVGNEVDSWLAVHPDEVQPYIEFVASTRDYIHSIEPRMGVGATITYGGIAAGLDFIPDLLAVSDAAAFTYYPLNPDFTVRDPSTAADDLALMVKVAGDLPILFQEIGYPSGYLPTPSNNSSPEKQSRFFAEFFAAVERYPQIRFISVLHLSDWSEDECDFFAGYYGSDAAAFKEYLCSLGLWTVDGQPKPAYQTFLDALKTISALRS